MWTKKGKLVVLLNKIKHFTSVFINFKIYFGFLLKLSRSWVVHDPTAALDMALNSCYKSVIRIR